MDRWANTQDEHNCNVVDSFNRRKSEKPFQTHIFRTLDAFNDDTMRTTYIAAALILAFANPVTATYNYIAGYEPGSDVDKHNMIDLDVRDIQAGLPKNNGGVLSRQPLQMG